MGPSREAEYDENFAISEVELARDSVLFGLRMNEGVCLADISDRFGLKSESFDSIIAFFSKLEDAGMMDQNDGISKLSIEGRMRCDAIALEIPEIEC